MSQIRKEIKTLNKKIISVLIITFMFAMIFGVVKIGMAVENAINCTVTAESISLSVSPGAVSYGVVALSGDKNTTEIGGNTQVVNNDGTVAENFQIKSGNALGTAEWVLNAAKGSNQFLHKAAKDSSNTFDILMNVADTLYTLKDNVANDTSFNVDLWIGMPTGTSDPLEHTISVTIVASKYEP